MKSKDKRPNEGAQALPVAEVAPVRGRSWAWILPLFALALVGYLGYEAWSGRGTIITVRAVEGHGLKTGDPLTYRGITVGEVTGEQLADDLSSVVFSVRLSPGAVPLAQSGSRFWIVRPHLSLDSVQGLETIIGARTLAVLPGPPGGDPQREFVALVEPPVSEAIEPGGLEIALEAPRRFSLAPGAPIAYREIQVGSVLSVGLSSDATSVDVRAYIRPEFAQIVRENTVFWEVGGIEIHLALMEGLEVEMESLRSLLVGGIALATPPAPGPVVLTGHRFTLHGDADEEWLEWRPPLPIGNALLPQGSSLPRPLRAQVDRKKGFLRKSGKRQGWLLPTPDGLLGPADLLKGPGGSEDPALELAGERFALDPEPEWAHRGLARVSIKIAGAEEWPTDRVRIPVRVEDCLVAADPASAPIALSKARLSEGPAGWVVDSALAFDESWHGACVIARKDGSLVGILLVDDGDAVIAPPPVPGG